MADRMYGLLVGALLAVFSAGIAQAQTTPLPAAPVPVAPPSPGGPAIIGPPQPQPYVPPPGMLPPNPYPAPQGAVVPAGPCPPCPPSPCAPGQLFPTNPAPPPVIDGSFFVVGELDFLQPHVSSNLSASVFQVNGTPVLIQVPSHTLNFTVSPTLGVGTRLPDNTGEFLLSYQFIATEGKGPFSNGAATFDQRSRLNFNIFDFDYYSCHDEFLRYWDFQWHLGARVATAFYDTQISNPALEQKVSNYFVGVGPDAGFEIRRQFQVLPGFALFGRVDGAVLIGRLHQTFTQTIPGEPTNPATAGLPRNRTQSVPVVNARAGLAYTPPFADYLHFSIGAEYQRWWSLGQFDGSRLDLDAYGVFLRAQFDY